MSASCNPHLRHNNGVLPYDHVVGDLNQVVRFHPSLDPCLAEGGPVDAVVGSYLHFVVDLDDADLRDFDILRTVSYIAESIAPDDRAGMNGDIISNDAPFQDCHVRVDDRSVPYPDPVPHENAWEKRDVIPDDGLFTDVDQGKHRGISANDTALVNQGLVTDS